MKLPDITNEHALAALVEEIGFLPFFDCGIPGFSLKACTPRAYWFVDGVDGPWEWRERVLDGRVAYGKVFQRRAGFVSRAWLPDFCNYRRDGYDFEGFFEDGFAPYRSKALMDALTRNGPMQSRALRDECGYRKDGEKGFEGAIALLQMQTFVTIRSFDYARDRLGRPYGWGLSRYARMEDAFGEDCVNAADATPPAESKEKILAHLARLWPEAGEKALSRLLG